MYLQIRAQAELERRRRVLGGLTSDRYAEFRERYRMRPDLFVLECIKWNSEEEGDGPSAYQLEVLSELPLRKRVSVRGPHGIGKTALAAWIVLWYALTRDGEEGDWKTVTTASAWRQLTKYLWPEVRKWRSAIRWERIGRPMMREGVEAMVMSLKLSSGEAFAVASNQPALIEGAHADHMLYIYDEAKTIIDETYDATEGAFSTAGEGAGEAFALAISTPGPPTGRFYDIQSRKAGYEDWWVRHVTLDEAIEADRVSADWAEARKRQWGEKSAVYQNRVLGEFAVGHEDGLIPLAWIEDAIERWHIWQERVEGADGRDERMRARGRLTGIGVDVGGGGADADKSTLAFCYDHVRIQEIRRLERDDVRTSTMELADLIMAVMDRERIGSQWQGAAIIDTIGIGTGAYNRLQQMGVPSYPFVASKSTRLCDVTGELGFANWRSAAWCLTKEMLDPDSGLDVCLPPDDMMIGDLTAPTQRVLGGRIRVEAKEDVRKRLRRSTDVGDAVVQVLVGPTLIEEAIALGLHGAYDVRYMQYEVA